MNPLRRIARGSVRDDAERYKTKRGDVRPNTLQNITAVFPMLKANRDGVK